MMGTRCDLTITIVSWNTRAALGACLTSLNTERGSCRSEVHVVDNASSDGSSEYVRTKFPAVCLLENSANQGFARACNESWRLATGRYWMLLNSDATVRPGALDALVRFMDNHPRAGLATARVIGGDGKPQHCVQPLPRVSLILLETLRLHKLLPRFARSRLLQGPYCSYDTAIKVGWAWGTALVARREAVEQVGSLDERFFVYGEDIDWCYRMHASGWEVWLCPEAEVEHLGGLSSAALWDDSTRLGRRLDGICEAIALHRGAIYMRAWCRASLAALAIARVVGQLRGAIDPNVLASIAYFRARLGGASSRTPSKVRDGA